MDAATATRVVMGADVSDDGQIFVPNMQSGSSTLSPFKVYKWTVEGDTIAPTAAFSQINPATTNGGFRFGDTFAVRGSGTSLKFAAAGNSSGTSSGLVHNGDFMIGSLDVSNANTIYRNIPNTLIASNDYRLGITFVDSDTVISNQGTSAKITDFVPATTLSNTGAIVTGSIALAQFDGPIDYTVINGQALLATVNTTLYCGGLDP